MFSMLGIKIGHSRHKNIQYLNYESKFKTKDK
jgi:hypothetical protein